MYNDDLCGLHERALLPSAHASVPFLFVLLRDQYIFLKSDIIMRVIQSL